MSKNPDKPENPLAALIDFNDARVQTVYQLLCDTEEPPEGEHWEGWTARRILAALEAATPPDLVEAGKVLEGVTPGPWECNHEAGDEVIQVYVPRTFRPIHEHDLGYRDDTDAEIVANARFIAWCREGVPALIALATAQAAQIAGLEAQLTNTLFEAECEGEDKRDAAYSAAEWQRRAEAAEAQAATLRAEVERLRGALQAAEAWIVDGGHVDDDDVRNGETGARRVYEQVRAALEGKA